MKNFFLKIKSLVKAYWLFILLAAIVVLLIGIVFSKKAPGVIPPPLPSPADWQGIQPGKTTELELEKKLGQPSEKHYEEEGKMVEYPSTFEFYPHQVYIQEQVVTLIKEQVSYQENLNLSSYQEKYGQPSLIMYETNLGNTFPLNIFLNQGVAVAAHVESSQIIEVWYFPPMTETEFIRTIGEDLSPEPFKQF